MFVFPLLLVLSFSFCALAEEEGLAPIRVEDMRDRLERAGKLKDTIVKTEVINDRKIERKQAKTLTEAVTNEPGIDAATGCSICGMKRIQINGLRGEYTTVLVDDVPIHSTVSSYYGMDALTTAGIARIEVARGAGASLLAPGALGGVINIVSQKATENGLHLDASAGNGDQRNHSLVGNSISASGARRTTVSAQHSHQGQWDGDANGVNESPRLSNYSLGVRMSEDFDANNNLDLRLGLQRSDVFGGPMAAALFKSVLRDGSLGFVGNDVRQRYTGAPVQVLETIQTTRFEGTGKWTHRHGDSTNSTWTLSGVSQTQDSFYEGADYANLNLTLYTDGRLNHQTSDTNLVTFGVDGRAEGLRAESDAFFASGSSKKDDFNFFSAGLYAQDSWTPSDAFELSGALRLDRLGVNWTEQTARGYEIDQWVVVPRLHLRWTPVKEWSHRLSLGKGYRAPLTFFESEHGILDDGFDVRVTGLEQSWSAVYSVSFDNERTTATASAAWTNVANMAYVDLDHPVRPVLLNDGGNYNVLTTDGVFGFQLTPTLTLGASYEHFFYENGYKALLPFAAVEQRARLMLDYEKGKFDFNLTATAIGGRDLGAYGYANRYNIYDGADLNSLAGEKLTQSPFYVTFDTRMSYEFSSGMKFYAGVKNISNFTQAAIENPLFYDSNGEFDVIHIWGPLRGREVYVGLSAKL